MRALAVALTFAATLAPPPALAQAERSAGAPAAAEGMPDSEEAPSSVAEPRPGFPLVAGGAGEPLRTRLLDALAALGPDHEPRTEHRFADGSPVYVNRLVAETSPYLLQHAHNPIDWYPWGEEAFAAARAADKPVFLSIGYATCHWCHVMERESFENLTVARRLNEAFIAIKVDREQLPDVDAFYMTGVQLISGGGGWPMSSFLDAEGRPFHGGTYFPPDTFHTLLGRIAELWQTERDELLGRAGEIAEAIAASDAIGQEAREVGEHEVRLARERALIDFDPLDGGFGGAPKFPREPTLFFLLGRAARAGDVEALAAVERSLEAMAAGGIHDHVGGGFHRYTVDRRWRVPHFEKMLYNQAALARLYAQAWELGGEPAHARVARRTLDYALREMTAPDGTFYSATDADSEGEEGRFFVWTPEELDAALGEEAALARAVWNVTGKGNFEGHSILHTDGAPDELARAHGLDTAALVAKLDGWTDTLLAIRERRERPLRDDKIITAWNGMMVTALTEVGERLGEARYLAAAERAADRLWETMHREGGLLWRARFNGSSGIDGTQLDYAFLAEGLIALYDARGATRHLERATRLADTMIERFRDPLEGGFFMGGETVGGAALVARPKDLYDNAMPAGNSVALRVLSRLHARTGERRFGNEADALIAALSVSIAERSGSFHYLMTALEDHLSGESGHRRFAARGKVRAEAAIEVATEAADEGRRLVVDITLAPGWHVNAHEPLQDYLIPTVLSGAEGVSLGTVDYPEPEVRRLAFQREPLALHEGRLRLSAGLPDDLGGHMALPLELRVQACSDRVCLAPETLVLSVPLAALERSDAG